MVFNSFKSCKNADYSCSKIFGSKPFYVCVMAYKPVPESVFQSHFSICFMNENPRIKRGIEIIEIDVLTKSNLQACHTVINNIKAIRIFSDVFI